MTPDQAYANGDYIEDAASFPPKWNAEAKAFRASNRCRLDVSYADHPREVMDIFQPDGRPKGVMMFIHGGYWRAFDKGTWSHLAKGACANGWAVVMPSYPLCPEVRISDITRSMQKALIKTAQEIPQGPIALTGHSAGGHLVLRLGSASLELPEDVAQRLKTIIAVSPLSDLRPLRDTAMNSDFRLDAKEAVSESPLLDRPRKGVSISTWVGAEERPAFLDQSRWIAMAWDMPEHIAPGRHHFDVIDPLEDPNSPLVKRLLDQA